ncbi:MAG: hypothetical protein QHJ73_18635, partial [Armatimonadota bacterium]|nr:hypothetical protein [Armatimonadota bacterium]
FTSTLLTLFVVPAVYTLFDDLARFLGIGRGDGLPAPGDNGAKEITAQAAAVAEEDTAVRGGGA